MVCMRANPYLHIESGNKGRRANWSAISLGILAAIYGCQDSGKNVGSSPPSIRPTIGDSRPLGMQSSDPANSGQTAVETQGTVRTDLTGTNLAGAIDSSPLVSRSVERDGPLFETLDAKQVGLDYFHKKSADPLLSPELTIGSGVAMGDYNGDGLIDVFLPRSTDGGRLFRNLGGFHFEDTTEAAGILSPARRWTTGATFVDIDDDGDLDLYVCGHGCPNHLYINEGSGKFVERGRQFGLDCSRASVMMAFADYDRDGDLDAYLVTNHLTPAEEFEYQLEYDRFGAPQVPERYREFRDTIRSRDGNYRIIETGQYDYLYLHNGDGTFRDVSETAGIRGTAAGIRGNDRGLSATWWDYNDDRWPDLYVANDFYGPDRLYRNNHDGTFTDVLASVMPHTPWFSMGSDVGDINNDGRFDFMGTDMSEHTDYRRKMTRRNPQSSGWFLDLTNPPQYMRNAVYLNTGAERFHEIAHLTGMDSTNWTWSTRFVDLDQDGRQDVHITNGMSLDLDNNDLKHEAQRVGPVDSDAYRRFWDAQPLLRQHNFVFRNLGDLRFKDVSRGWGLDHFGVSFGAAFGDLDNDGDLDLVVNNFEDNATIARNTGTHGHAVRIRLRGTVSNRWGIGATVRVRDGENWQASYLTLARGFMSASDPTVHFGLGDAERIDELVVEWPNGQRQSFANLPANRLYTITEPAAPVAEPAAEPKREFASWFARATILPTATRSERLFDDFVREPLLPFRLSRLGPGIAVADVNGDRLEDLFLGGPKGSAGALILQSRARKWAYSSELFPPWSNDGDYEQLGVLLFDADGDDDLDLFVVTGGNECEPNDELLRDRLYLNDGHGVFSHAASEQVPDLRDSGSVVAAADYDRDGDLDLYVGSRCVPGRFPETPASRLLNNQGGTFSDQTLEDGPDLLNSGLVTSALWSDANGDGWVDLLVTHDWGPIKLFVNDSGKLRDATSKSGPADRLGWWNGVAGRDLDDDGDLDYVCTNLGHNTAYRVSADRPARLFYGDFNEDGQRVLIEAAYDEQGRLVPTCSKAEFQRAIPLVESAFPTFHKFASATLADIVGSKALDESFQLSANTVDSVILRNDGQGHFAVESLPILAQLAPGFGAVLCDFDADGITDIYIVQNNHSPRPDVGRMDGGTSVLLLGRTDATYSVCPIQQAGLLVPGDAKSVAVGDVNEDGWPDLIVGINDGEPLVFEHQQVIGRKMAAVRLRGRPGNPTAVGARVSVEYNDGLEQTAEVQAGGGYLSQQSAVLYFGLGDERQVKNVTVRWPNGEVTSHRPVPDDANEILISQPDTPQK
jgi:hypothetical protein